MKATDIHLRDSRIGMVRVTAWITMGIALFWVLLSLAVGYRVVASVAMLAAVGSVLAIVLIDLGHDLLGRILWFGIGTGAIFAGGFLIHPAGNIPFMFAPIVAGPFLIFSRHLERGVLYTMVILSISAWVVQWALGHDFFGPPLVDAEAAERYYALPAGLSALLVLTLEVAYFDATTQSYGRRLRDASAEAQSANRAKSDLLAAMSHEIRTPMNGVVGMIELLETSQMTPEQKRMLATVRESSFALLRIIDDILDVSKAEAGKLTLRPEPLALLPLIESVTDTLVPLANKRGVWLSQIFDTHLPATITADGDRLRQILVNLIANAIKFSEKTDEDPVRGHVILEVRREGAVMRLTVRDNGVGMDAETMSHAFEPYMQSNAVNSRRFGGTGLGLAIVHQLVKSMDGAIAVDSAPGQGTTIDVRLPIVAPGPRLPAPDLSGVTIVAMVTSGDRRAVGEVYLIATGAQIIPAHDEENLHRLAREHGAGAIYILAPEPTPRSIDDALVHRFQSAFPTLRCLTFSARPSDRFGSISPTTIRLQWNPLKLSELWSGLQMAAGRREGTMQPSSAEEAVAANLMMPDMPRILLVEDNEINREVLSRQLMALGYSVDIAKDGAEGLQLWRENTYPVVLTDCHMPLMDGFEMTTRIREIEIMERRPRSAVVAITANALEDESRRCRAAGMDTYLSKPVRLAQLKDTLAIWTHPPQPDPAAAIG